MATVTWNGSTAEWSDASGWSTDALPASGDTVSIPDGTVLLESVNPGGPVTESSVEVAAVTVANGAGWIIQSYPYTATVTGDLTDNGGVTVDSTAFDPGGSTLAIGGTLTVTNAGNPFAVGNYLQGAVAGGGGTATTATVTANAITNNSGTNNGAIVIQSDQALGSTAVLDVASAAGFSGETGVLVGSVSIGTDGLHAGGDGLLEFASGQITTIQGQNADFGGASLFIYGTGSFVADADDTSSNSALTGLTTIDGSLGLQDGADVSPSGSVTIGSHGSVAVDTGFEGIAGSNFAVADMLTVDGSLAIGRSAMTGDGVVTAAGLASTGTISIDGADASDMGELEIGAAAGFGTADILTGSVDMSDYALLQFTGGEITTIAQFAGLNFYGGDAFIADSDSTTSNSALTGLTTIDGGLTMQAGTHISPSGSVTIGSNGAVSVDTAFLGTAGSVFAVADTLTVDGSLSIGRSAMTGDGEVTAAALSGTGSISLDGADASDMGELIVSGAAGIGATTGAVTGDITLQDHSLLQFGSGQISTVDYGGSVAVYGANAFIADSGSATSNSALEGLTNDYGSVTLDDADLTTTGGLTIGDPSASHFTYLNVDNSGSGGAALHVSGALTFNDGAALTIGNTGITVATTATATALTFNSTGLGTSIAITGSTSAAVLAALDINSAAGTNSDAGIFAGDTVTLQGDSLLDFAGGGGITTIDFGADITIFGPDAFIAAGTTGDDETSNSALNTLSTLGSNLALYNGALVATDGDLTIGDGTHGVSITLQNGAGLTVDGALTILSQDGMSVGGGGDTVATLVTVGSLVDENYVNIYGDPSAGVEGTLKIDGALSGDGAINLSDGGTVEIGSTVTGGGTIAFGAGGGAVKLDTATTLGDDALSNFTSGDTIDVKSLTFASTYIAAWSGSTASGTLDIEDSANSDNVVANINLTGGSYASNDFAVTSDGSLGTEITFSAGPASSGGGNVSVTSADSPYDVSAGATASGLSIESGGTAVVLSGGTALDATVSSGGALIVDSAGVADPTVILSGGSEIVSASGSDDGALISGGEQDVYGYASGATVFSGAQVIEGGGTASGTILSGSTANNIVVSGGSEIVSAIPADITNVSGGNEIVAVAAANDMNAGDGSVTLSDGGGTFISVGGNDGAQTAGGTQLDYGLASGTTVFGGLEAIESGGTASGTIIGVTVTSVTSATVVFAGAEIVSAGAADFSAEISGGSQYVGGYAFGAQIYDNEESLAGLGTIDFSGLQQVSGGTASGTVIFGGVQSLIAGGSAIGTTVFAGGTDSVDDGGVDIGARVSGGLEIVSSGGVASSTMVSSGGTQLASDGTTFSTTIDSGGVQSLTSGATAIGTVIDNGGTGIVSMLPLTLSGLDGAVTCTASGTTVSSGGAFSLLFKGLADLTTIYSGGSEIVGADCTDDGARISGGTQDVYGTASAGTMFTGLQVVEAGTGFAVSGGGFLSTNGWDYGTQISGGEQEVYGYASGVTVFIGSQVVEAGGQASATFISGGSEVVSSGGTASGVSIGSAGTAELASGAIVSGPITFVGSGGTLDIGATASASLSSLTISGLGVTDTLDLTNISYVAGATALVSGGFLDVTEGGSTYKLKLGTPNTFPTDQFTASSDGVNGTEITLSAPLFVSSSSHAQTATELKAGGTVSITLDMSEQNLKVTGTPGLTLNDGGTATYLASASNLTSGTLVFKYTVGAGQNTADLEVTGSAGGTWSVTNSAGVHADFSSAVQDLGLVVDTQTPKVSAVSVTPASGGTAAIGATVAINLDFGDAPLVVSGTPTLKLSDGGTAYYNSGGSSDPTSGILEFDYTVASGQTSKDLDITGASVPKGASITDLAGNAASLTLTATEENLHVVVSGIPPKVTSVTASPAAGDILSGGSAVITLKLSEAVTVGGGGPILDLNDGGTAIYDSQTNTSTLGFTYSAGSETTTDLTVTGIRSAGTVTDAAGNTLSSTLSAALKIAVNIDFWKTGKSGDFDVASNWSAGAVPSGSEEAALNVAGAYTVSVGSGENDTVGTLAIGDKTATLLVASGGTFSAISGTGADANLGSIVVDGGGTLDVGGTIDNSGTIALNANSGSATLGLAGDLTLTGGGKVTLSATGGNAVVVSAGAVTLTNVNNLIEGAGLAGNVDLTLINSGTIDASSAAALTLDTGANVISNAASGKLEATANAGASGGLVLESDVENAGTIGALGTSARVVLDGVTVSDTGSGAIVASGAGANVDLDGTVISGGTLKTAGAKAVIETVSGTTDNVISGATVFSAAQIAITSATALTLTDATAIDSGGTVTAASGGSAILDGTVTNSGAIVLSSGSLLVGSDGATLAGGGKVTLTGGSIAAATNTAATFENLSNTIEGSGLVGGNAVLTFDNLGTIEATTSATLMLDTAGNAITNAGTAGALGTNAHLTIDSNLSNSKLLEAAGANAVVQFAATTTVDNVSGTILASGGGAQIELDDTTISNGTLKTSAGGVIKTASGLDNTISGGVVLSASLIEVGSGTELTLSGETVSSGAIVETLSGSGASISGGVLTVSGGTNLGTLFASGAGSLVLISGAITGGGSAKIDNGVASIQASGENVVFQAGGSGQLQLADAEGDGTDYTGKVSGFGQNIHQTIDLQSATVTSGANVSALYTLSYTPGNAANTSGSLMVSSGGSEVADITLVGHYTTANFKLVADFPSSSAATGTLEIIDPPINGGVHSANVGLFGNYIAGSFVGAAGLGGSVILSEASSGGEPPPLAHPHA